jgi:hypothetical protein
MLFKELCSGASKGNNMSDRAYMKAQAQQKTLSGSSPKSGLLQRTCACGQHTIAGGECEVCRNAQSPLLRSPRVFEPPLASVTTQNNSPTQENVSSLNSDLNRASHFGHDFSRIPVYSSRPPVLQTKLTINQPGDSYEQEADQGAKQVMRMSEPQRERACACDGGCPKCQTEQPSREHESLQTKPVQASNTGQIAAPPIVHEVLRSPGQPLDPATRAFMEPRFGHDFSRVRVHSDADAEQSTQDVNAHAYTVGHDIVFGAGRFAPGTNEGRRLIAHELTHVVQQSAGQRSARQLVQRDSSDIYRAVKSGILSAHRESTVANVHRLGVAHLRWTQTRQISAEDLEFYAPVEIVTGQWKLPDERYDLLMAAFSRGPHVIQLNDLPDHAQDFFFMSEDEFQAEHAIRVKNAVARMEACGGARQPRPSAIPCINKVLEDVAPTEFALKDRGYAYMVRGMAAGAGAMSGGNPIEMGALVFAHNVLGWSPERSKDFASAVSGAFSIAGATYVKVAIEREPTEGQQVPSSQVNPDPIVRVHTPEPPMPKPDPLLPTQTVTAGAPEAPKPTELPKPAVSTEPPKTEATAQPGRIPRATTQREIEEEAATSAEARAGAPARSTVPPKPPTGGAVGGKAATGLPGATGWRHLPRGTVKPSAKRSRFPRSSEQIGTAEQRKAEKVRARGERVREGEVGTKVTEVPEGRMGLRDHWEEHGRGEFPEYRNAREYEQGAIRFCLDPATRRYYSRYGRRPTIAYYNVETNTFAVTSSDGETIYTYYRPEGGVEDLIRKTRMPDAAEGVPRTMAPGVKPRHSVPLRQDR